MGPTLDAVLAARQERHGVSRPAVDEDGYLDLFRRLQPVSPEANSYPGSPPRLHHRTAFDDADMADGLRAERRLVKGRFHDGTVGYVYAEDLPLYAAAYRRPLQRLDLRQEAVLRALTYAGPLSPRQLREETGLRHRPLMAAVHRLERAFVVCEDQTDDAWDRPLHLVEREFPELAAAMPQAEEAVDEVLVRLVEVQVFATTSQLASGSGLGKLEVGRSVRRLESGGRLLSRCVDGQGEGWARAGDVVEAGGHVPGGVRVLHLRDPLVRPHLVELRECYAGRECLQYLLIDDRIAGAVCGHWRIKPHDVEEVVVDADVDAAREEEVLEAVRTRYPPPDRRVLAYNGRSL